MKKIFSLLLLCATIVLASCSKDDAAPTPPLAVDVTEVTLNKSTTTIEAGKTETLTATVAPEGVENKAVTWSSNKTDFATVDDAGVVTAVKEGTAIITATSVADNSKTATCTVTVTKAIIAVTGVTFDKTTISLEEGKTATLVATVAPADATNQALTWSSNKTDFATVDDAGVVTAVKEGTAIITATSVADDTKRATCTVTVTKATIAVTSVTLDKTTISLEEGKTAILVATVAPGDATNQALTWSSDKTDFATVTDAGVVTAVKEGAATITVTSVADATKSATCVVTVTSPKPKLYDYYYSDGTYSTQLESGKTCIGVVIKVGKDATDTGVYTSKAGTPITDIKAYVLALQDVTNEVYPWGPVGIVAGTSTSDSDFNGYSNTQAVKAAAKSNSLSVSDFPAVYHASEGYEATQEAPANSSGWFLPSAGQYKYCLDYGGPIFAAILQASGKNWKDYYWTSSEAGTDAGFYARHMNFNQSQLGLDQKNFDGNFIRSILVF